MIPILYESTETTFTSNGIGRLADCTSCTVTEERNGIFECTFTYPITGRLYSEILIGRIVSVIHDDTKTRQPFEIYRFTAPINGLVTFNAHHISYELSNVILSPFTATSVADALAAFVSHSTPVNRFTFWTDKTTTANFAVKFPKAVRDALGGSEGSILDVYGGGEYKFDKFDVKLYAHRGNDSGVVIRYGKNLIDIENEFDMSETYNAVVPYWKDDTTVIMLPEVIITQADLDPSAQIVAAPMDLSEEFDEVPTVSQLRTRATAKFNKNKPWEPSHTITVDFVSLWQTDEYKYFSALQRVGLCDTVTVFYPEMGVNITEKVIRTVYDVLTEKYDKIELGTTPTNLYNKMAAVAEDAVRDLPSKGFLDAAIAHATELITGGLGGHVVFTLNADGEPEEILIMDTDDVSTAVNVWRFNQGGLGHSSNGYEGPYSDIALTMDGKINASMITTGIINANLIRTGMIQSVDGVSYWDLVGGGMKLIGDIENTVEDVTQDYTGTIRYATQPQVPYFTFIDDTNYVPNGIDQASGEMTEYKYPTVKSSGSWGTPRVVGYHSQTPVYSVNSSDQYGTSLRDTYYFAHSGNIQPYIRHVIQDGLRRTASGDYSQTQSFVERVGLDTGYQGNSYISYGQYLSERGLSSGNARMIYSRIRIFIGNEENAGVMLRLNGNVFVESTDSTYGITINAGTASIRVTGSTAKINGNDVAFQTPSSRRYKENIKDIEDDRLDPHRLYDLPVRQFTYRDGVALPYKDIKDQAVPGFIAEEVNEIYPGAVVHDNETGEVETWDERRIIPGMLALLQEQKKKIDELEKQIEALESAIKGEV